MSSFKTTEKIKLFALIEPVNVRLSLCFPNTSSVSEIHSFVDDTMKKFRVSYKTGRIDHDGYWILPQYRISDFLKDGSFITVYSIDYGMNMTNLAGEKSDVKIQHASIASGNMSLVGENGKNLSSLGKKKHRPQSANQPNVPSEKKQHSEEKESEKKDISKSEKKKLQVGDKKSDSNKVFKPKAIYRDQNRNEAQEKIEKNQKNKAKEGSQEEDNSEIENEHESENEEASDTSY